MDAPPRPGSAWSRKTERCCTRVRNDQRHRNPAMMAEAQRKDLDRRSLLAAGGAAAGLRPLAAQGARAQRGGAHDAPVVETTAGKVAGASNGPVSIFKGI